MAAARHLRKRVFREDISVLRADPVGRYALRIVLSDGHHSALYNWHHIRKLTGGN